MVVPKNDDETGQIEAKLDTIIRLLAMDIAIDKDLTLQQKAVRLRRAGIMPKEIAELCGSTSNAVNVALSTAKSSKSKKKVTKKKEASNGEG